MLIYFYIINIFYKSIFNIYIINKYMRTLLFTESPMLVYILFYITITVNYKYNNYIVLLIASSLLLLFVYFYRFPPRYEQFKLKPLNENNIIA